MVRNKREGLQYYIDKYESLNKFNAANVECDLV